MNLCEVISADSYFALPDLQFGAVMTSKHGKDIAENQIEVPDNGEGPACAAEFDGFRERSEQNAESRDSTPMPEKKRTSWDQIVLLSLGKSFDIKDKANCALTLARRRRCPWILELANVEKADGVDWQM